jgi:hypothetical protein
MVILWTNYDKAYCEYFSLYENHGVKNHWMIFCKKIHIVSIVNLSNVHAIKSYHDFSHYETFQFYKFTMWKHEQLLITINVHIVKKCSSDEHWLLYNDHDMQNDHNVKNIESFMKSYHDNKHLKIIIVWTIKLSKISIADTFFHSKKIFMFSRPFSPHMRVTASCDTVWINILNIFDWRRRFAYDSSQQKCTASLLWIDIEITSFI